MSPARRHDVVAQAKFCARMNWWELESLAEQFVRARASNTTTLVPHATDSVQEWPIAVRPIVLQPAINFPPCRLRRPGQAPQLRLPPMLLFFKCNANGGRGFFFVCVCVLTF